MTVLPNILDKDTLCSHCYQVNDCQEYLFQPFSTPFKTLKKKINPYISQYSMVILDLFSSKNDDEENLKKFLIKKRRNSLEVNGFNGF